MKTNDDAIRRALDGRLAASRAALVAAGVAPDALERRVGRGVRRLARGVYAGAGTGADPLWTAWWAAGPRAVVSHRSAAAVWELRGVTASAPELTVPHNGRRTGGGMLLHSSDALDPPDVVVRVDGLPLTSPARTLLDIGTVVGAPVLDTAFHDALARQLVRRDQLDEVVDRLGGSGRRGTAALRRLLRDNPPDGPALESELEVRFERLVRRQRLPQPVRQLPIHVGRRRFRVDFAYPAARLGIELLGAAWHTEWNAVRRDRERNRLLTLAGLRVLQYDWHDVTRRQKAVADEIRAALGRSFAA